MKTAKVVKLFCLVSLLISISPSPVKAIVCQENLSQECSDDNIYNGYWWRQNVWVPGLVSVSSWFTPNPQYAEGNAVFFGPGAMEATAKYRGFKLNEIYAGTGKRTIYYHGIPIAPLKGSVSLMSPADIGLLVWLKIPKGQWEGPYVVVDCAARQDIYPIIVHRKEIIEVSYTIAQSWGMIDEAGNIKKWQIEGVEVSKIPPPLVTGEPVEYRKWWLDRVNFISQYESRPIYRPFRDWYFHGQWETLPTSPDEITYEEYVKVLSSDR